MSNTASIKTPLYICHEEQKAKYVDFHGVTLPIWYSSLKDEHQAVREGSGIFDISHMGVLELSGEDVHTHFQTLHTNSQAKSQYKMTYSMMLNENGGVLDDIMFALKETSVFLVVNASNKEKIINWINAKTNLKINDLNKSNVFMAIQGPKSVETLQTLMQENITEMPKFGLQKKTVLNSTCWVARSGYTGEDGVEILINQVAGRKLFRACIQKGITPCGLGARDTLRLEAGLPLYGQELSESINPYMTRYKWVVKEEHTFIGKSKIMGKKDTQLMATVGLEMVDRVIPRTGYTIEEGGTVTSGTMSPQLNKPIAMALVKKEYAALATEVTVIIRNKPYKARVVKVPFIKPG